MSLSDRLTQQTDAADDRRRRLFRQFGVIGNPFPPAGQPAGHPHLEVDADERIFRQVQNFLNDAQSHVVVVEGEQGVGKTNLLSYYDSEFRKLAVHERIGPYIVRYYSDPEPSFEGVLSRIFQELGEPYIRRLAETFADADGATQRDVRDLIRNQDFRTALEHLKEARGLGQERFAEAIRHAYEWVTGHRLLNRHRQDLGVYYRLDTLESKTQVLRDLMEAGSRLGVLKGIFLLLDELEKQDYTTSKTNVLRFLLAIRALIDALPRHLFLMVALTPTAKNRYFQMVPAVQSRMQNGVTLRAFRTWDDAARLVKFYMDKARDKGRLQYPELPAGEAPILPDDKAKEIFQEKLEAARRLGGEGVTPRDFLDGLHNGAEIAINAFVEAA